MQEKTHTHIQTTRDSQLFRRRSTSSFRIRRGLGAAPRRPKVLRSWQSSQREPVSYTIRTYVLTKNYFKKHSYIRSPSFSLPISSLLLFFCRSFYFCFVPYLLYLILIFFCTDTMCVCVRMCKTCTKCSRLKICIVPFVFGCVKQDTRGKGYNVFVFVFFFLYFFYIFFVFFLFFFSFYMYVVVPGTLRFSSLYTHSSAVSPFNPFGTPSRILLCIYFCLLVFLFFIGFYIFYSSFIRLCRRSPL